MKREQAGLEGGAEEGGGQVGEPPGAVLAQRMPGGVGEPVGAPFDLVPAVLAGNAVINGTARQPESQGRLQVTMFLIIGLVEGMYFINLALAFVFIFAVANGVS